MESAVLSQHVPTLSRFLIREDKVGSRPKDLDHIAYAGRVVIRAERIWIEDSLNDISQEIDQSAIVCFDNECYGMKEDTGDLSMLYDYVLKDPDTEGRKFLLERNPEDDAFPDADRVVLPIGTSKMGGGGGGGGGGDTNYLPFLGTLPCNKFVASTVVDESEETPEEGSPDSRR
jgi:hypothetical protein